MRIGVLIHGFRGGGAERVAATWARALTVRGHDVVALTFGPDHGPDMPGVVHERLAGRRVVDRWAGSQRWLRRVTARHRLDVVLSLPIFANLVSLSAFPVGRTPKLVISERNILSQYARDNAASDQVHGVLARFMYRRADAVIAISHPVAADLARHCAIPQERLWVVPNPTVDRPAVRSPASPPTGPVVVGYVGRLVWQKRPLRLVQAATALRDRGVAARLVVAGDGPLREPLRLAARAADIDLELLGWVDDWADVAQTMDCMLLPSEMEGFGNVLVEATLHGVPVVTPSSALGVADAVVPGVTGVLALSPRPDHLATAVLEALAIRSSAESDVERWLRWFGVDHSCDRLEQVLTSVVSGR